MTNWRRPVLAYLLAAICGFALSCSTTDSTEQDPDGASMAAEVPPALEVRPYLVEPSAGLIMQARPETWHEVRPMVEEVLAGEMSDPSAVGQTGPSANRPKDSATSLFNLFGNLTGHDVDLDHLATDRPLYMILSSNRHHPSKACLLAGLPCMLLSEPGPWYGRFLLPTDKPKALVKELREEVGRGLYLAVPHRRHVRVEFAVSTGADSDIGDVARHLEIRSHDRPLDIFDRRTPARSALVDADVPFGVYVNLRDAVDAAMYLEQWKLFRKMNEWPIGERMRNVLDATASIGRMTQLDTAEFAETEDVSLLVGGDAGAGYTMDLVSTRTTLGRKMAKVAGSEATLPELSVGEPSLEVEWNMQLSDVKKLQKPADWVTPAGGPRRDVLSEIGGWGLIGLLRSPSAVALKLGKVLESRTGGLDLDRIVAARLQFDRVPFEGRGFDRLRGGGALLLASGDESDKMVSWFRTASRFANRFETNVQRRSDGKIELRFGLGMEVGDVIISEGEGRSVDRFTVQAHPDVARRLVEIVVGDRMSASETSIDRVVSAFAKRGTLRLSHEGTREWFSARMGIEREPGVPLTIRPVEFSTRQPKAVCFDKAARLAAKVIEDALAADDLDAFLAEELSSRVAEFRNTIADCGGAGDAEAELADWGVGFFNGWHGLIDYRVGNDVWSKRLLHVCEDGQDWACEPATGEWPWLGTGETAAN